MLLSFVEFQQLRGARGALLVELVLAFATDLVVGDVPGVEVRVEPFGVRALRLGDLGLVLPVLGNDVCLPVCAEGIAELAVVRVGQD